MEKKSRTQLITQSRTQSIT